MIPVAVSVVVVVVVVVPVSPLASVVLVSLSSDFAQENTPNVRTEQRIRRDGGAKEQTLAAAEFRNQSDNQSFPAQRVDFHHGHPSTS